MAKEELNKAYEIFSQIILVDPNWAEGWNKRATVLYLMGRYQDSLIDIDEVLKRENRHFGALSGQGLVQTKLKNYEKAIKSYQAVQKIYPSIRAAKVMIPQLKKLIKYEVIWKNYFYARVIATVKNTKVINQEDKNKNFNIY